MRKRLIYSSSFLLIVLFLVEFFHPITAINVDLGRHILLGKIISTTHQVPHINLLSYTYPNFPYSNSSWLSDVFYSFLYAIGGFNLLLIINTVLIAGAFGLLVSKAIQKNGVTTAMLFSITLYLLLLGLRPDIRPEVMSMVCLSLFITILYVSQGTDKRLLFVLIPIELLWVNVHIYFFVGPLLIVLFLLDFLIKNQFTVAKTKEYFVSLAGTLLVTCINPNGIQGAIFPLTVLHNYGMPVAENQSILTLFTIYHSPEILLPVIAIILLFLTLFLARKNTQPVDWLLAIVFSLASIIIFRNILLFIFTTFLSFTTHVHFLVKRYHPFLKKVPRLLISFSYFLLLLFLVLFVMMSIGKNGFGFGVRAQGKGAVNFLLANNIKGPIYNNFDIGDYLSFRLYPKRVFVENRPEAYPARFFQQIYIPMQNNPALFRKIDRHYMFNTLIISYWDDTPWGSKLLHYLVNNSHFTLVYVDPYTMVLVRNTQANTQIIKKYLITKESFSTINHSDLEVLIHYLFFFEKVGWNQNVQAALTRLQKYDPQLCSLTHYPLERTYIQEYITKHRLQENCAIVVSS